jgi:LytTr DNA-binding domain
MMNLGSIARAPFPFFFDNTRLNLMLAAGTALFVWLFLLVFQPFEPAPGAVELRSAGVCLFALTLHLNVLPVVFPRFFDPTGWTFGKHLLFNYSLVLSIGLILAALDFLFFCPTPATFADNLWSMHWKTVSVAIIPTVFVTFLIKNRLLRQNLQNALRISEGLHDRRGQKTIPTETPAVFVLKTDTLETFTVPSNALLFAVAEDNYTELHWLSDGKPQRKLLRLALKNLETQLPPERFVRCHRSYIVNLDHVRAVSGNTNGFKLHLFFTETEIPVSRSKGLEISAFVRNEKASE